MSFISLRRIDHNIINLGSSVLRLIPCAATLLVSYAINAYRTARGRKCGGCYHRSNCHTCDTDCNCTADTDTIVMVVIITVVTAMVTPVYIHVTIDVHVGVSIDVHIGVSINISVAIDISIAINITAAINVGARMTTDLPGFSVLR